MPCTPAISVHVPHVFPQLQKMPRPSAKPKAKAAAKPKADRVAVRQLVLHTWASHPELAAAGSWTEIGRRAGGASASSVRNIVKRWGPEFMQAASSTQPPPPPRDAARSGRPTKMSKRFER